MNEYYTPKEAFMLLQSALVKSKFPPKSMAERVREPAKPEPNERFKVWECFGRDFKYIESPHYIKELGYKVIADGADFWESYAKGDFVISNPPYCTPKGERNIKERILERLCSLEKPFCLLMPTSFLQTKCFKRVVDRYGKFQIVMPSTKIQFYQVDPDTREKVKKGKCSFYTAWFCWNMGFESDFIMV